MTGNTTASGPQVRIWSKILLTLSPFVLLVALFLIHRWLS